MPVVVDSLADMHVIESLVDVHTLESHISSEESDTPTDNVIVPYWPS